MYKEKAINLLKKIGVKNEVKEIKDFKLIYENKVEKSFSIVTEYGEVVFRIVNLEGGQFSKLDYFNTKYEFNRNVNLYFPFN